MKRITKRVCAGLLAVSLLGTMASFQAMAMPLDNQDSAGTVYSVGDMNDVAWANRIGLDNDANNRQALIPGSDVSVNLFSGNLCASLLLFQNSDVEPMDLILTYNSLDNCDYGFGKGIRTSYSRQIIDNQDGTYTYMDITGSPYIFRDMGDGTYQDYQGRILTGDAGSGYHMLVYGEGEYDFDADGKMIRSLTGGLANSRTTTISYTEDGLVNSIYNSLGMYYHSLEYKFEYSVLEGYDHPMVTSIHIIQGKASIPEEVYSFAYDNNGLSQIVKPDGTVLSCAIDDNGMLSQIGTMEVDY